MSWLEVNVGRWDTQQLACRTDSDAAMQQVVSSAAACQAEFPHPAHCTYTLDHVSTLTLGLCCAAALRVEYGRSLLRLGYKSEALKELSHGLTLDVEDINAELQKEDAVQLVERLTAELKRDKGWGGFLTPLEAPKPVAAAAAAEAAATAEAGDADASADGKK